MTRCKFKQTGFTLLEIVVALAIVAVIFAGLYGTYHGALESTEAVESGRELDQAGRLVLSRLAADLQSLYLFKSGETAESSSSTPGSESFGPASGARPVAEFATTAHLGFEETSPGQGINRVSYVLAKEAEDDRYYRLLRLETPYADLGVKSQQTSLELADMVEELVLTYVDADGRRLPGWNSDSADGPPRLVEIELRMASRSGGSRSFRMAVAPMAAREYEREGGRR